MNNETFTYQPACQPDTWVLCIGPDRFLSAALNRSGNAICRIDDQPHDLYQPNALLSFADSLFPDRRSIREIRVSFLLPEWTWLPTDHSKDPGLLKHWLTPYGSDKPGHVWKTDVLAPSGGTAWVRAPRHLIRQLDELCANVVYKHGAIFEKSRPFGNAYQLELMRLGDSCWLSLWEGDRFLHGQPQFVSTPEDLLYSLVALSKHHGSELSSWPLKLSGQWEIESKWLNCLRSWFKDIESRDCSWQGMDHSRPAHWFTPLEDILTCE